MTKEEFKKIVGFNGSMGGLSFSVDSFKDKRIGIRFYSGISLEKTDQLNGPWLATSLLEQFKDSELGERIKVCVPRRNKNDSIIKEGSATEIWFSGVEYSDENDKDAQIKTFGEQLRDFIKRIRDDIRSAQKRRARYNTENSEFVQAYAKRRRELCEGLNEKELTSSTISTIMQEKDAMTDNTGADSLKPCFWKFSYKAEYGELTREKWEECKSQNKIAMQKPRSQSDNPTTKDYQRELFLYSLRKGDYVCVWEEGKVSLLVEITDEDPPMQAPSHFKVKFVERTYKIIAKAQPDGNLDMCAPKAETMFARVAIKDSERFTDQILPQCFGMDENKRQEVLSSRIEIKYWVLVSSSDKNKRGNEWDGFLKMDLNAQDFYYVYSKGKDGNWGSRREKGPAYIGCREGDIMLGYDGNPDMKVCALLRCSSVPYLDTASLSKEAQIWFEKTIHLDTPIEQSKLNECKIKFPTQTSLFPITPMQYESFMNLARKENPDMDESVLNEDGVPKNADGVPMNLILFGPPGTGKTYHTVIRAVEIIDGRKQNQSLTEGKVEYAEVKKRYDDLKREGRIQMVTFHQAYGYEEFIGGIRPESNEKGEISYPVRPGVFVAFCKKAKEDFNKKYVFIIDEINRGNVAKIFGELITLLEENKRLGAKEETTVAIPGFEKDSIDEKFEYERCFAVPQNVYIIGTMNTADRSLAKLDVALRRRFVFEEMMPKCELLPNNINGVNLNEMLKVMNLRIQFLVDREHQIGHAWLMGVKDIKSLGLVFRQKIIPLLQEYFYDDYSKIRKVLNDDKKEDEALAFFKEISKPELGAGWLDDVDDVDARYELNEKAFDNLESYRLIYET